MVWFGVRKFRVLNRTELNFSITNAKTAPIALEALHHTRDLITSVATLLHEHPRESNLSHISKQLDAVTTRLGTLNMAQVAKPLSLPKTQSYASVLATGV